MKVLVTGAEGFVGGHVVSSLVAEGHEVVGAVREDATVPAAVRSACAAVCSFDVRDPVSIDGMIASRPDAVVHLAAVSSGGEASRDPRLAWEVNTVGVATVMERLVTAREAERIDPVVLVVSTAEVYGDGPPVPRQETDATRPMSPYAASKLGGEIAALEAHRRSGVRVIVVRPFPHTGAGQDTRFVVPAFAERILAAKRVQGPAIKVGNLAPVRDIMHVTDVVAAYVRLLEAGTPGEVYNVASGEGHSLADVLRRLGALAGYAPVAEVDARLVRSSDLMYLVGDANKLRAATGWQPTVALDETLADVLHAQTH